ncbi:MAG: STAS domain-containing protein [Treponemataceae bacterium]|nr:STAS domain-containing protein [Treponemataceae bacterium]
MDIYEKREEHDVELKLVGRLDAVNSVLLQMDVEKWLSFATVQHLYLDFSELEYISSAAIRVLLKAQKEIKPGHELIIKNPSEFCSQVFQVTGADIFLTIEDDNKESD